MTNVCLTIEEARALTRDAQKARKRRGLVPTMGALHEGHLSLVRAAKQRTDFVAVSIFVNPLQFGPTEDFSKYPRSFERDRDLLQNEGVDLIFAPSVSEMYPQQGVTYVNVDGLSERLDGKSRPGHFRGVTTVVAKLLHILEPDAAFFGQKDAAQLAIIRRMVRDLNMPVEIVGCPIVREPDGLAMSSRNAYLNSEQRRQATVLYRCLMEISVLFQQGERNVPRLIEAGGHVVKGEPAVRLDFLEAVDPDTLETIQTIQENALVAIAAFVGTTRLIDNVLLQVRDSSKTY
jgi:pantoate--beta-alanine ligase